MTGNTGHPVFQNSKAPNAPIAMTRLQCPECGTPGDPAGPRFDCPCGGLLDVILPSSRSGEAHLDRTLLEVRRSARNPLDRSGVWRFREWIDPELPPSEVVSLGEGNLPTLRSARLAAFTGIDDLSIRHEGWNPTGSFKDRGMTVAVSRAKHHGARRLACASTGNTSASLAAYGAAAGLPTEVLVPKGAVSPAKLAQAEGFGATIRELDGDFDTAMARVREEAASGELALLNSLNPWRIEGQKSIVFELLDELDWEPPDWLIFPAGNLGNTAAFGKALRELRTLGMIERTPRLAAVQAEGAAPFARAFERDFAHLETVRAETLATAIRIGDPVSYPRAVRSIRETNGLVLSVDDSAILEAKHQVDRAGIGAEPASCASIAGAAALRTQGHITPDARVVCILTGHHLKQPLGEMQAEPTQSPHHP